MLSMLPVSLWLFGGAEAADFERSAELRVVMANGGHEKRWEISGEVGGMNYILIYLCV